MVSKVIALALLVACTQAIRYDGHEATSSIQFNENHNTVHHIQSQYAAPSHGYAAPAAHYSSPAAPVAHYSAHAAPVTHYAAPAIKVAAPVLIKNVAPSHHQASSYSSVNFGNDGQYSAPAHYAAPSHYAAPAHYAAPSHYAAPVAHHTYAAPAIHAAPVAKVIAPVAKFVAPVAKVIAAPAYHHGPSYHHEEEYGPAKYEFAYGVEDHHTGDIHSHKETRDGDVTHGEYSLHEADGTIRTVKYSVDKHSGFNAVVERSGHSAHAQPAKAILAAPVIKTAPYYHH